MVTKRLHKSKEFRKYSLPIFSSSNVLFVTLALQGTTPMLEFQGAPAKATRGVGRSLGSGGPLNR